jgi:hypothetical protein
MMNKLIILVACSFMTACATGYNPRYYFNEVQVVNLAGATIQDVSLQVVNSSRALDCAEVVKFAMCADRFGRKYYPQQGVELGWTHPDGSRKSENPNPAIPAFFASAIPLRIVLEVREDGTVKAFYEQDEPGRDGVFDING